MLELPICKVIREVVDKEFREFLGQIYRTQVAVRVIGAQVVACDDLLTSCFCALIVELSAYLGRLFIDVVLLLG